VVRYTQISDNVQTDLVGLRLGKRQLKCRNELCLLPLLFDLYLFSFFEMLIDSSGPKRDDYPSELPTALPHTAPLSAESLIPLFSPKFSLLWHGSQEMVAYPRPGLKRYQLVSGV
jgi:hypothetical protein